MKATVAILLLTMAASALADTAKRADDRPIVIYKAGQPFIFDSKRTRCCATSQPVEKAAPVKPVRAAG